ncbi:hypothetical protein [Marinithermus hydrothermalis]|uniref:Uncharacterized protein n=1 Tax=Marinithermus hydrothermalis (strain DSM 14884 / JCM 11576 / T1) TaxID=869210 RepID=F2NN05_MARHT|nr:hypothetical protein [Marinithermus hydrothermalis]AEB12744.1 hypothetical protein Marky_2016 [Marinithermus hydrothermalis DSM 14884]
MEAPDPVPCAVCGQTPPRPLWVVVDGAAYPTDDATCAGLLRAYPLAILGPRVELRYRPGCPRCEDRRSLWLEVAARRPLRLRFSPTDRSPCPRLVVEGVEDPLRLVVEGVEDPLTLEMEGVESLLSWLAIQYPGLTGCC